MNISKIRFSLYFLPIYAISSCCIFCFAPHATFSMHDVRTQVIEAKDEVVTIISNQSVLRTKGVLFHVAGKAVMRIGGGAMVFETIEVGDNIFTLKRDFNLLLSVCLCLHFLYRMNTIVSCCRSGGARGYSCIRPFFLLDHCIRPERVCLDLFYRQACILPHAL